MEYAIWCPEWGLPEDAADKYAGRAGGRGQGVGPGAGT
jgi:hypothetical protein